MKVTRLISRPIHAPNHELEDTDTNKPPYLLTPWCRVLLENLTGLKLVKKFPAFY